VRVLLAKVYPLSVRGKLSLSSFVELIVIAPPDCECKDNSREMVERLFKGLTSLSNSYPEILEMILVTLLLLPILND